MTERDGVSRGNGSERERLATRVTERVGEALKACDGTMGARRRVCGVTAACAALGFLRDDCKSCSVNPVCCVFASLAVPLSASFVIVWERPRRRCVGTGGSLRHVGPLRCMSTSGIRCVTLCVSVAQQRFFLLEREQNKQNRPLVDTRALRRAHRPAPIFL